LPAENYAIKTGVPPSERTEMAISTFIEQINNVGISVDWDKEVGAHRPDYYEWTQWIFLQLFKAGLAYKKAAPVNWCPQDQTVLANEQVIDGKCERCGTEVVQKDLEQWFFKITDFAERLDKELDSVDWPDSTKMTQRNWIGMSEGAEVDWEICDKDGNSKNGIITVYTTRFDTIPGPTFMVVAPEYSKVWDLTTDENKEKVEEYIKQTKNKTDLTRLSSKEKTGVITGSYAKNPFNGSLIPIYVTDYVLANYGTGAVMGMPGHDQRDWDFAKKFNLPVIYTAKPESGIFPEDGPSLEEGTQINSGEFDGLKNTEAKEKILDKLVKEGKARRKTIYRLRDWLVSRQRYWGCPIPIIYCDQCKAEGKGYHANMPGVYPINDDLEKRDLDFSGVKKVLVLHGTGNNSQGNWFQWIKQTLGEENINVAVPDLPSEFDDKVQMEFLAENYKEFLDENTVIIGHSSGATTALKIAERFKVKKLIMVSPVLYVDEDYKKVCIESFGEQTAELLAEYANSIDSKLVNANASKITILFGLQDPYTPVSDFIQYAHKTYPSASVQVYKEMHHFNIDTDNLKAFPELLQYIAQSPNTIPVRLPKDVDFRPTGESPLTRSVEFNEGVKCPNCGASARREVDTMDTFVDSSWYFFRFCDAMDKTQWASSEAMNAWLPTDLYMIGAEHIVLHLLYSRFFTKFFYDKGYIKFNEPFYKMRHMGLILGPDGRKMSKRWGNVINPDDEIKKFGADAVRMYEMFMGPLEESKPWSDTAENGVFRFLGRVWNLQEKVQDIESNDQLILANKLIKKISQDIETLSFNTAVAKFMEFVNDINKFDAIAKSVWETFLLTLAPFAPFIAEELWSKIHESETESIHIHKWPSINESLLSESLLTIAVQVNGKVRGTIQIKPDTEEKEVVDLAMANEGVKKYVTAEPKKIIYIKNKILNIIV